MQHDGDVDEMKADGVDDWGYVGVKERVDETKVRRVETKGVWVECRSIGDGGGNSG